MVIDPNSSCADSVWHIVGKLLTRAITLLCNWRFARKVMGPQSRGSPSCGISGLPLGKKTIWMCPPWRGAKYTIRGKVVASPKSELWWLLWVRVCSWLILAPKVFQLCTNHLVLVLCRSLWVIEACQFFLVPSRSSITPLYPSKVLQAREHAPTPCSSVVFCLGLTFGVPQGVRSTSYWIYFLEVFSSLIFLMSDTECT